ncbi:MAG: hypothetical protein ACMG57_00775 [Candidatus Dojkabacteria bacterium]
MKKRISTTALALIILLSASIWYLNANGVPESSPQTSIGVNPAIVEVVIGQDNTSKQEITIYNLSDKAIPIEATKEGFSLADKADVPNDKIQIYDASSWITLSLDDTAFILKPGEIRTVTLNIAQPENSSPGGHYATVYFHGLNPQELLENNSANISIKLGVLVLIQSPGEIVDEVKIKDFSSNSISNIPQLTFNLSLENTGNVHLLPTGKINFYNDLTNELIKSVDLDTKLILPGLVNTYSYNIDPGFQVGKVSAQAVIKYGATNKVVESEKKSVLIFPFMYLAISLVLLLFVIVFRRRILKALKVLFSRRSKNTGVNEISKT